MKLKRILALAVSLAMVLSIVPALDLTASAAGTTGVIDALGGDVLWACPDGTFNDTAIGTAFSGWSSTITSGYVNVKTYSGVGNVIQYYVNGTANVTTITSPGYGDGTEEKIIIEWVLKRQNPNDLYFDFSFTDKSGTEIAFLKLDKNHTSVEGQYYMGYPAEGTDCAIVAYNNADGSTHTVQYYVGGSVVSTVSDKAGTITGFGGITSSNGRWSTAWNHIGFGNLTIGAVYPAAETEVEVTATYTAGGATVKTVTGKYDTTTATGLALSEYYYRASGTNVLYYAPAQELSATGTIEMSPVTNWGNYTTGSSITFDGTPYVTTGGNIVPNGDFEHGMNGWYNRANTTPPTSYSISTTDKPDSATRAAVSSGNGGASSTNSIKQAWDITPGTTYYYSLWVKAGDQWHGFGESDDATTESQSLIANGGFGTSNAWVQKTGVFTATKEYLVFFEGWSSVGLADVEVYPVEIDSSKIANTTIKFVNSSDGTTEIATAKTVTGVVGDVIDLTNTTLVPSTITYNGNPYSLDSTNPTSYTVVGNTDTVVLTYSTDAFVSFTADAITVIAGNDPIMPTTVTAVTGTGATTTVSGATWTGYTGLSVGTHTINGTVTIEGNEVSGSTTVTVLEETFSMSDMTAYAGQNTAAIHYFPTTFSGDATIEFDVVFKQLVNGTITIGDAASNSGNCPIFGGTGDAISIQTNSSGMNIRSWGASGGASSADRNVTTPVVIGDTYRILITTNTDNDTWSAVMTDKNGVRTVVAEGHGYRKVVDKLDSVTVLDNNGKSDTIDVSNFRVYAVNPATTLTTYTVKVTGSVTDSYTEKATSADAVKIPYYEGNILKTRSISGTTVTLTYAATEATLGSWATRNNVTTGSWLTEMKYLGSHNSFADTSSVFNNEGGDLFGDTGATSSSSTVINKSRTQSVGVYDQLNAGVRYFDIRLSRQSDGTFAIVHGPAFEQFKPILVTIAQFAAENPGEVILLDFQHLRDALYTSDKVVTGNTSYYGETAGDDNKEAYEALAKLLEETGVADYFPSSGAQGSWDKKWGDITNNGAKAVILPFAKARGCNCYSRFINRSTYTSTETTYIEDGTYSNIVSNIDSTLASVAGGASFGIIHAYRTPGVLSTTSILSMAATDNPKWISEANFATWMGSGKGDILLLNDVVTDAPTYLAKLAEYNRDGFDATYTNTVNGVTAEGATAAVPFSTSLNVASAASSASVAGYTPVTDYNISLMQFDANSVQPSSALTLTFPQVSDGTTTVDVLLSEDGSTVLAEAGLGEAISYSTTSVGKYILATKVAPTVNMTVNYQTTDGEVFYTDARDFVIGTLAYNIPASARQYIKIGDKAFIVGAEAQSHTVTAEDEGTTKTVTLTLIERYAVLEDMLVDSDNNVWGINATNSNSIFVAANSATRNGPGTDDDGVSVTDEGINPATLGGNRNGYLQFPVVSLGDGEAAIANFYVRTWHGNTFANGNTTIRISGTAINDDSWTTLTDGATYTDTAAPKFTGYTKTMFTNRSTNTAQYIQMDVTEMMKAAEAAGLSTITIRLGTAWGAAYIAEREACVAGGAYEGNASFIDVVPANTITVTGATKITKNGTTVDSTESVVVADGSYITLAADSGILAFVDRESNLYTVTDGKVKIDDIAADTALAGLNLGVALVDGAQVRIGAGVKAVEGGYKIDDTVASTDPNLASSGLRFIAVIDGGLAGSRDSIGAEVGIEIAASNSTAAPVKVKAEKFQDEANTVFTAALVNMKESNYNRVFTATPYVTVGSETYRGDSVSRSIYEVAAGVLVSSTVEGNDKFAVEVNEGVKTVLNAYVNQVGVRLNLADGTFTARTEGTGAYVGGKEGGPRIFFDVTSTANGDGTYSVTITTVGDNAQIFGYWDEYIRLNNQKLSKYITNADTALSADGKTLTLEINPNA